MIIGIDLFVIPVFLLLFIGMCVGCLFLLVFYSSSLMFISLWSVSHCAKLDFFIFLI